MGYGVRMGMEHRLFERQRASFEVILYRNGKGFAKVQAHDISEGGIGLVDVDHYVEIGEMIEVSMLDDISVMPSLVVHHQDRYTGLMFAYSYG